MYNSLYARDNSTTVPEQPAFEHAAYLHYSMIITIAVCLGCATPMVWVRMYVHLVVTKLPQWDDILVIISWLDSIAFSTGLLIALRFGLNIEDDLGNFYAANLMEWKRIIWICEMIYAIGIALAKLPVLVLYRRIFVPPRGQKTWVYYTIVFFTVFNTLYYFVSLMAIALSCVPSQKVWDKSVPGHCINLYPVFISSGVFNVLADGFMVIVPVAVISKLQMPRRKKIEILFVFAFGIICVVSAIVRLYYSITGTKNPDQNVALIYIAFWALAEIAACNITACVPMVPLMVRHVRKVVHGLHTTSHPSTASAQNRRKAKKGTIGSSWPHSTLVDDSAATEDPAYLIDKSSVVSSERHDSAATDDTSEPSELRVMPRRNTDIVVSTTISVSTETSSHPSRSHARQSTAGSMAW